MFIMRHGIAVHGMGTEKYAGAFDYPLTAANREFLVKRAIIRTLTKRLAKELHHGTRTGNLYTGSTRFERPEEEVIGIASDSVLPAHVALALPRFHTSIDVARSAVPTGYGTVQIR
ncbi:unnamed protein product [Calypogeia fissa]